MSDAFCKVCNRIRLTAEGQLRTCLLSIVEHNVKALLRGASDDQIRDFIAAAVWPILQAFPHLTRRGDRPTTFAAIICCTKAPVDMSGIAD